MKTESRIRPLAGTYLYNMLQDFRHLLIFDLRQNFDEIYIRDSFNVRKDTTKDDIQSVVYLAEKKASQKQNKYKQHLKRIRRYYFIGDQLTESDPRVKTILEVLQQNKSPQDKLYCLKEEFSTWAKKYFYMCLSKQKYEEVEKKGSQQEKDRYLLYPYAKFPSQIIPDKLYLGNVYSSNSQKQLEDMQIKSMFDFIDYNEDEKIPDFKEQKYSFMHLPFNTEVPAHIDFDIINEQIDKKINQGQKVLIYCKDGQIISPAFVISYLMYKTKLDINTATLKVCQAISRVQICKWIYTQLLIYKPKK